MTSTLAVGYDISWGRPSAVHSDIAAPAAGAFAVMRKVHPRNKLRFIWFGGEELGLLGSTAYINSLSPSELSKIGMTSTRT
jgi:Zn-dependent M28 family amino/carboxypeptidase